MSPLLMSLLGYGRGRWRAAFDAAGWHGTPILEGGECPMDPPPKVPGRVQRWRAFCQELS